MRALRYRMMRLLATGCVATAALLPAAPLPAAPLPARAAAETAEAVVPGAGVHWTWPVAAPHRILSPFQAPATRYSAGHRGIDIAASPGTEVVASVDATVHFSGIVVDRRVVTLRTASGVLVSMEPVIGVVPVHTAVRAGERIGTLGAGGHCDTRCLHFGVRVDGRYVSPLLFLGGAERAILLPLR